MRIIHFSDSHAGGPAEDWLAYLDKRWVGVFNYRFRRRFQHDQSMLSKAVDYILADKPDLAVCTGDLTSSSQPGEFKETLDILSPLRDSGIPLVYVPGNHDYYVYRRKCVDAMKDAVRYLNQDRFFFDELPLCKTYGELDLIIINTSWPSNLLSSCGYLRKATSQFVADVCAKTKDRPRVLINHYPIIEENPVLRFRHRLWGQNEVKSLLDDKKIDLSLCGHVHRPYTLTDETGRGEICAGSITRNGTLAVIDYQQKDDTFNYQKIELK